MKSIKIDNIESVTVRDTDRIYSRLECNVVWLPYKKSRWFRAWDTKEGFYSIGLISVDTTKYLGAELKDAKDEIYDHLYFDWNTKTIRRKAYVTIKMVSGDKYTKYYEKYTDALEYQSDIRELIKATPAFRRSMNPETDGVFLTV